MRAIFLLITIGWLHQGICQSLDWDSIIKNAPIIVEVHVDSATPQGYGIMITRHLKGPIVYDCLIKKTKVGIPMQEGEDYLVLASGDEIHIELVQDPIVKNNIPTELQAVLDRLPCFLETETAVYRKKTDPHYTGACPRNYDPVCGCNGVTYANACDAQIHGTVKYSRGECHIPKK